MTGDASEVLATLPADSVDCCVTSPPYFGLRDNGTAIWEGGSPECDHQQSVSLQRGNSGGVGNDPRERGGQPYTQAVARQYQGECGKCGARSTDRQIGMEAEPEAYIDALVAVFREVRRVLKPRGTCWIVLGDSTWEKNLLLIPARAAMALQADGWMLRSEIIWAKKNCMPSSARDRPTRNHETIYLLTKSARYDYDYKAIEEDGVWPAGTRAAKGSASRRATPGVNARPPEYKIYSGKRNKRTVWTVNNRPYAGNHRSTYPPALIEPCILAGSPPGGTVLDPFAGTGTTGEVALKHGRHAVLIELNPDYVEQIHQRLAALKGS